MASVLNPHDRSTSTQWLSRAIRLFDREAELTALNVLYDETNGKPDFDLTADQRSGDTILVIAKSEFELLSRRLPQLGIPYEQVEVKPMSQLDPETRKYARGFGQ